MDLGLFVQRAAKITATDGLSFQGLIFFFPHVFVLLDNKTN